MDKFYVKYVSQKLNFMFQEIEDFVNFKDICRKQGIQFHTFTLSSEEILTVVVKGLIKLEPKIILNNLKTQGLKPIDCTEISTHMKYPESLSS